MPNRAAFDPRPGDLERVRTIGVDAYLEQQLYPHRIPDPAVEEHLRQLRTTRLDTRAIVREFHLPAQYARRRLRMQTASAGDETEPRRPRDLPEEIRRERTLHAELIDQKLIRAVSSERQLQETLVDFWFNHFNVSARKGPLIRPFLTEYERDVIRPQVLGHFRDLLGAVAKSPAMLIYLDNWLSSDPDASRAVPDTGGAGRTFRPRVLDRGRTPRGATVQPGRRGGINENYARELLELHTLGVDGGYRQEDVVEVARAMTGWTPSARFDPSRHKPTDRPPAHAIRAADSMSRCARSHSWSRQTLGFRSPSQNRGTGIIT